MIGNISTPGGIRPVRFGAGIGAIGGDTYRQAIVNTGPVSYWRLGEASGTNAADEMGANAGTYVGTPTLGATGLLTGDSNTAMTLTTNTQGMQVGSMPAGPTTGFTFLCWAYRVGAWSSYPDLFNWNAENTAGFIEIGPDSSGKLTYQFSDGTLRWIRPNLPLTHDALLCVAIAHDFAAKTAAFYVNGVSIVTSDLSAYGAPNAVPASKILGVGRYTANNNSTWVGTIDEPAIWNRALSPAEVAMLNAIGKGTW